MHATAIPFRISPLYAPSLSLGLITVVVPYRGHGSTTRQFRTCPTRLGVASPDGEESAKNLSYHLFEFNVKLWGLSRLNTRLSTACLCIDTSGTQ